MSTIVKGELNYNTIELIKGDSPSLTNIEIKLLIDGKEIPIHGSSISRSASNKSTFEIRYEGIESVQNTVELLVENISLYKNINAPISLSKDNPESFTLHGEQIEILEIEEKNNETLIKVKTKETTALYDVSLLGDSGELDYLRTETGEYEKTKDGIFYTRTFIYKGISDSLTLDIGYMYYSHHIDEKITIPIN